MSLSNYKRKLKSAGTADLISNFDFYKYVDGSLPIIQSSQLHPNVDLFNNPFRASVILIEMETTNHWVLINKSPRGAIEFYDSYGIPFHKSQISHMKPHLGKVTSNKIQHQEYSGDINTCGKHVLMRLLSLLEYKMNLRSHNEFISKLCDKFNECPDKIVRMFVTDI